MINPKIPLQLQTAFIFGESVEISIDGGLGRKSAVIYNRDESTGLDSYAMRDGRGVRVVHTIRSANTFSLENGLLVFPALSNGEVLSEGQKYDTLRKKLEEAGI